LAKILIIDDDDFVINVQKEFLVEAGHEIEIARDGEEGIDKIIMGKRFDLVICDLAMPNWNGLDAVATLDTLNFPVKVLIISGYLDDEKYTNEFPKYKSIAGSLKKPFRRADYMATINKCLKSPLSQPATSEEA
jgi:CheY-like chemotaxis protein